MDRESNIQARKLFQRVFTSEDGRLVLGNILTNLGYFETDPKVINPDYIAFANRLLNQIGINHRSNLINMTNALVMTADSRDLEEE